MAIKSEAAYERALERHRVWRKSKEGIAWRIAYEKANRDKINKKTKAWAKAHPESRKATYRRVNQSPRGKYRDYAFGARKRGIPFVLTFDEFMVYWQKPCSHCGASVPTIGLDRIDNDLGYTPTNIIPCCEECNMARKRRTLKQFIAHCKRVANFNK